MITYMYTATDPYILWKAYIVHVYTLHKMYESVAVYMYSYVIIEPLDRT